MLFLRLSWVVAQAGIGQGILLIGATSIVTTITALSMSAISTNGVIKGGGTYYMISRSLGPEFGGSIGLIFSLANAVACAMYVVGFSRLMSVNFFPDYRESEGVQHSFFSVFSIFFPAATGILAGANISGDLKDPQVSIPKGTILSIILTSGSYVLMAFMAGATVERDASGNITELYNGTFTNCTDRHCAWGLHNSFQVMELASAFGPLIYAGCFAATLSSALASLVSAPKVFQALCKDQLYPYITWFAKGYGKNNEPYYNMWLSLGGALLCVFVMFLISWWTALITLACVLALYLIVAYRKPDVNWGSSTQAQTYKNALISVLQLNNVEDHVKNYRPQILVLSGLPSYRPPLIDFAYLLTKNVSLLICGHILKGPVSQRVRNILTYKAHSWLKSHKIKAFYTHVDEVNFEEGAKAMIQASGVGKLRPNILLMGFKGDWRECDRDDLAMYFEVMHKALDMYMAVAILRLQEGLDYSKVVADEDDLISGINAATAGGEKASSASDLSAPATPNLNKTRVNESPNVDGDTTAVTIADSDHQEKNNAVTASLKDKKKRESRADLYRMASLLHKFRIDYSDLKVIPDITKKPKETTVSFFDSLISEFKLVEGTTGPNSSDDPMMITEAELLAMNDKTNRHLRLRELVMENSLDANLVVMTLPMPRKNVVSATLYMAWLETLTRDMPPFLLVRGNQTSVLTFYS
ncbi:Solute carrier family 12 member 2 [Blattella germanica]|nr:Solute carrier family 12 member 2 [Blattella germanica]